MYHIRIKGRIYGTEWETEKAYPLPIALHMIDLLSQWSEAYAYSLGKKESSGLAALPCPDSC